MAAARGDGGWSIDTREVLDLCCWWRSVGPRRRPAHVLGQHMQLEQPPRPHGGSSHRGAVSPREDLLGVCAWRSLSSGCV